MTIQLMFARIQVLAKTKGKQIWLKQKQKNYLQFGATKLLANTRSLTTKQIKGTATMKKEITTPSKQEVIKGYAASTIKVALALAFVIAALNLGGYLQLSAIAKEILAGINGLTGVWILISNVR